MILLNIFIVFLRTGLLAIGGAYSFLPLLEKEVVQNYQWLSKNEFLEVLGMVKIFPGAISIKFATYTGYKMAGIPGAVIANLANLIAPAVLILFATYLYKYLQDSKQLQGSFEMIQLVVFAMILAVAFQTVNMNSLLVPKGLIVVVVAFCLFLFTKIHPGFIILGAGVLGAFIK